MAVENKTHAYEKAPLVTAAAKPPKPVQIEEPQKMTSESLNLSPQRIMEGVSASTQVLHEILARDERAHQLRHWGINE